MNEPTVGVDPEVDVKAGGDGAADIVVDVVVVGAGPAGLTCAATLGRSLEVALVDAGSATGGQYWRHPPEAARDRIGTDDLHHGLRRYHALNRALREGAEAGRVHLLRGHHVWTVVPEGDHFVVHAAVRRAGRERAVVVRGRRVVIATGAYDRQLPFPGWDLPGVLTVGGVQALLKGNGVLAGRRLALGGTGPFLLPVAAAALDRGGEVVALCEAAAPSAWAPHLRSVLANPGKVREGMSYARVLARHGVRPATRTAIVAAAGDGRVEEVTVARLDRRGGVVPDSARTLPADVVGVGWGFVPQLDLPLTLGCRTVPGVDGNEVVAVDALGRTSVPGVYASGESCGVAGASVAQLEGELAARAVLADSGSEATGQADARLIARRDRQRAFARAMHRAHPVPPEWAGWLRDDTLVCRCEEVSAATVRAAAAEAGPTDHRQIKQLTRAGMGWCQARMCGPAVNAMLDGPSYCQSERLVAVPITFGALADSAGDEQ